MSHFAVAVVIPQGTTNVQAKVEELLAPYDENGEWFADGSRWDYWTIGGRWDGEILGLDPLGLTEVCDTCNGTGTRDWTGLDVTPEWIAECNGCNGCKGTGKQSRDGFAFGPEYETLDRNACLIEDVAEGFVPFAFVTPDGMWVEQGHMGWFAVVENGEEEDKWKMKWGEARGAFVGHTVVLVDCHV